MEAWLLDPAKAKEALPGSRALGAPDGALDDAEPERKRGRLRCAPRAARFRRGRALTPRPPRCDANRRRMDEVYASDESAGESGAAQLLAAQGCQA